MTVKVPLSGVLATLSAIGVSLRVQQRMQEIMLRWELEGRDGPNGDEIIEMQAMARKDLDELKGLITSG